MVRWVHARGLSIKGMITKLYCLKIENTGEFVKHLETFRLEVR
jgi:hypothetical protein